MGRRFGYRRTLTEVKESCRCDSSSPERSSLLFSASDQPLEQLVPGGYRRSFRVIWRRVENVRWTSSKTWVSIYTSPLAARDCWNWWCLMIRMIVPGAAAPGMIPGMLPTCSSERSPAYRSWLNLLYVRNSLDDVYSFDQEDDRSRYVCLDGSLYLWWVWLRIRDRRPNSESRRQMIVSNTVLLRPVKEYDFRLENTETKIKRRAAKFDPRRITWSHGFCYCLMWTRGYPVKKQILKNSFK